MQHPFTLCYEWLQFTAQGTAVPEAGFTADADALCLAGTPLAESA